MGNSKSVHYEEEVLRNTNPILDESNDSIEDIETPNKRKRARSFLDPDDSETHRETAGLYTIDNVDDRFHDHGPSSGNILTRGLKRLHKFVFSENWLFLIVLGCVAALVSFGIDAAIYYLYEAQLKLIEVMPKKGLAYFMWIIWSLVFSALAILPIILISPYASGSGIPEMKCILSGIEMNRFLNFRTLLSKTIGLIFAYSSGLSIGKEGPFVHISSIICSLLTKVPFFKYIRVNNAVYMQVLSAASAVGVTSAFGTPVGGVFFSMEVTSTFYHVENLWRAFFVSVTAKLLSVILRRFVRFGLELFEANTMSTWFSLTELVAFAVMGVLFGVLSGLFVKMLQFVFKLSRIHESFQSAYGQLIRAAIVCLVIALIAFPIQEIRNDPKHVLDFLSAPSPKLSSDWKLLLALAVCKFVLTVFSVAFTGASAGVFGPVFLEGAILGKLFGEIMQALFPHLDISVGAYAIVGAAAFASGVTRTISTAVIVAELTLQVHLLLPVLLAVLLANFFGRLISLSVYAVLIQAKDLPQMPRFKLFSQASSKTAGEIMETNVKYLHTTATFGEVAHLCAESDYPSFPLVDEEGMFFGVARRAKLTSTLKSMGIKYHSNASITALGQKMLHRAKKQWEDKNEQAGITGSSHTGSGSSHGGINSHVHLEPEDLEPQLNVIPSLSMNDTSIIPDNASTGSILSGGGAVLITETEQPYKIFGRKVEVSSTPNPLSSLPMPHNDQFSAFDDDPNSPGDVSMYGQQVPFIFSTQETDNRVIDVDSSVLTISPEATITKVHFMFTVLGLSHLFVVRRGKLLGIITRKALIRAINAMNLEKGKKSLQIQIK